MQNLIVYFIEVAVTELIQRVCVDQHAERL
jgi:hypothetical protein